MNCCARSASCDQQLTRYQSVCSWRSPPSERPVMRLTATLNSQTGRPFGVIRSSGSRPTLPMMVILLTDATMSLVPSHHDVAEDVFRKADGALELARLRGREREFDDAVLAVAVVRDLVGEAPLGEGQNLLHLPTEGSDGLLDALADRAKALFVDGGGTQIHELVWPHWSIDRPFLGLAADLWPGAKRRRGQLPRRMYVADGKEGRKQSASSGASGDWESSSQ